MDRILRLPDVIQQTGLSRASIYRQMSAHEFPGQVRLGPRAVGWRESEIETWLGNRPASRQDPPAVDGATG